MWMLLSQKKIIRGLVEQSCGIIGAYSLEFVMTKLDYVAEALSPEAAALREGLKLTKNSWL